MEPCFSEGDLIFCYEPMLGRSRVLYEAKVIGVLRRRTREPAYKLRFIDWNKIYSDRSRRCKYDHEVGKSFLCKATEKQRRLMHKLTRAAVNAEDEVERVKVVSDLLVQAYNERRITALPPGLDVDDSKLDSPDDNTPLKEVKKAAEEHRIEIEIDDELKRILEHDSQQIKCKGKIVYPNGPTIIEILEAFMRYHANILLFEKPKHNRDTYKAEQRISLTKEVLEGIRCLFDTVLSMNLLYAEELENHESLLSGRPLDSILQCSSTDSDAASRRQTRSSTAETPQTESGPHDIFKTTSATQQLLGRLEQHSNEIPPYKKPRLVAHLQANSASGRSTPTLNPPAQQAAAADTLMKEVNEWRLVPQSVLKGNAEWSQPLPSSLYGATHLLRLFVILPDILTKMRLGEEWKTFLLGVFTYILSYLREEKGSLYDGITYVSVTTSSAAPATSASTGKLIPGE